jgi:hypothetical protein
VYSTASIGLVSEPFMVIDPRTTLASPKHPTQEVPRRAATAKSSLREPPGAWLSKEQKSLATPAPFGNSFPLLSVP